jgi:hypothetical protein
MATLPLSSMGMAKSGAWSLLKSPAAIGKGNGKFGHSIPIKDTIQGQGGVSG